MKEVLKLKEFISTLSGYRGFIILLLVKEIYRWSHNKGFLTVIIDGEIKAGDKLSFAEAWDMKDNDGNKVVPGNYRVTIKMLATLKGLVRYMFFLRKYPASVV